MEKPSGFLQLSKRKNNNEMSCKKQQLGNTVFRFAAT